MRTMDSFTGLDVIEPRTAFSYIRFSDPKQRKGFSKERQKDKELQLCKKHGWVLDTSLNIADYGRSGFKDEQVGLKVFLQAIKDGKVERGSVLIVERLDRLSRKKSTKHFGSYLTSLKPVSPSPLLILKRFIPKKASPIRRT